MKVLGVNFFETQCILNILFKFTRTLNSMWSLIGFANQTQRATGFSISWTSCGRRRTVPQTENTVNKSVRCYELSRRQADAQYKCQHSTMMDGRTRTCRLLSAILLNLIDIGQSCHSGVGDWKKVGAARCSFPTGSCKFPRAKL